MNNSSENFAYENTDKEIWRERENDFYSDSVFVTKDGGIGMNRAGSVVVKTVEKWLELNKNVDELIRCLSDLIDQIDCPESKSEAMIAFIHGYRCSEEVANKGEEIRKRCKEILDKFPHFDKFLEKDIYQSNINNEKI